MRNRNVNGITALLMVVAIAIMAGCAPSRDAPLPIAMQAAGDIVDDGTSSERIGGDTLLVVDRDANRLALRHDGDIVRYLGLPRAVVIQDARVIRWPARVLALAVRGDERQLLLLRNDDDFMVIDGTVALHGRHSLKIPNTVTLGNAVGGGVWVAQSRPDELSRVAGDGTVTARFEWDPAWVDDYSFPASPDPYIAAMHEDRDGSLWLFWRVAQPGTGPALVEAARGTPIHDRRDLYDTVVEVLDPDTRQVRARGYISGYVMDVLPDARIVLYRRAMGDTGSVGVYGLTIREPDANEQ